MNNRTIEFETDRYVVYTNGGVLSGYEKHGPVLKEDMRVLTRRVEGNVARKTTETLDRYGAGDIWKRFRRVGIKVNLCGGIEGCPSTFSDPLVVEGTIRHVRDYGAEPFVCEGDMRGFLADESMVRRRGELAEVLERTGTKYVNLSSDPVPITCLGLEGRLPLPGVLLDPETAVVSLAIPKDHWECGLSMAQKNMYGAISERRKAIYHRGWSRIDRAVAAAARILNPDLAIVGGRYAGAGWGPHFCVPVEWNTLTIGVDSIRVDARMAEYYGYPYEKVKYAMINASGEDWGCTMVEGSEEPPAGAVDTLRKYGMTPFKRLIWKLALFPQYFIPHGAQHYGGPKLEGAAARIHHRLVDPLAK